MKVVMPNHIDHPTTAAEEAQNKLRDDYMELFEELQDDYEDLFAAQDPQIIIYDLISYFRALDLVTILSDSNNPVPAGWVLVNNERPQRPKNKYYRLPLDEPYFEINTDDRTISVPSAFYNNGLGVQGDANAEIVFFKCPRLYDTIDLYSMVAKGNCWVQWTNNSARKSGNSQVLLCDVTEEYMFLGWMITSAMTSVAGALDFSVRWFITEGEGDNATITYSLSTQKATCNIKSTMDLALDALEVEKMDTLVYTRPVYAHVINTMKGLAPRIGKQLVTGDYDLVALEEDDPRLATYPVAEYPDGIRVFEVTAASPDGKTITYQWYKDGQALTGAAEIGRGATLASYTAITPGTYHVIIGNGTADGYTYVTSPTVVVPAPNDIKYIVEAANSYFGFGVYSDGTALTADITSTVAGVAPNGKVQVDWYFAPMIVEGELIDLEHATFAKVNGATQNLVRQENQNYVTGSYTPPTGTEGWYKCVAVNNKNNDSSDPIETADVITVRAVPAKPQSVTIAYDADHKVLNVTNITFAQGSNTGKHLEELRYRWNDGSEISAQNGSGFGEAHSSLIITPPTTDAEVTYNVKVSHRVYGDNKVTPDAAAGTAVQQESSVCVSNNITLKFVYGGNTVPTITVIS